MTPAEDPVARRIADGLARLGVVMRHDARSAAGDAGLPPTQAQILALLARQERPLGLGEVAGHLAITPGTASAAVSALVARGLLAKHRTEQDRRAIRLAPTDAGRAEASRLGTATPPLLDAIEELPTDDRGHLLRAIAGLIRGLQERGAIPPARICVGCRYFRPHQHDGAERPHHCLFIDAPIGDADLQLDCPDMEPPASDEADRLWQVFVAGRPLDDSAAPTPLPLRA